MTKFDAIVVGAGPAGSACGYSLAKAGLETLIVERGKYAGETNMGGGAFFGPSMYQLFPNFWEEAPVERYIQHHRFSLLSTNSFFSTEFSSQKFATPPYNGFSVLRSQFDRWFASQAEQAGAIVATGLQADDLLWEGSKVAGIKAGGDDLPADVVIACDGVNSTLTEKAGLRTKLPPKDFKQGVKEVIKLPREQLEQRFNLSGEEGLAWEFIGSFTQGTPGGAFLYTNKDSLSIGIVAQLNALTENKIKGNDLLEEFKQHPVVANFLAGGELVEYSAHLIPVSHQTKKKALLADGFLIAGDAAAFILSTGLILEGANFAVASGLAAAETVIRAKQKGDFTHKSLAYYLERLNQSFVMKDLKTFKNASRFLENPRIYSKYPEFVCELTEKIFTNDGKPKKKLWDLFKESQKNKISFRQIIQDLIQIKRDL